MDARRRLAAALVAVSMLSGCAYGATRPPSDVSLTAATLEGAVGDTAQDFTGAWWFELRGGSTVRETAHLPFSVEANTQEAVSARVTDLDQLGDPIEGTQRVRRLHHRTCVEGTSPPYGPLCSRERGFLTGDYVVGRLTFSSSASGATGSVAVESGPSGESPAGTVSIDFLFGGEPDVNGPITCLALRTVDQPDGTRRVYASMVVDDQLGVDALVRLSRAIYNEQASTFIEIHEPPADRTQCPEPEAISGSPWGSLIGGGPDFGDGPSGYSKFGDL